MEDFDLLQGKIADLTKTAKTPGGISLFKDKDKTTYKSTYELLKDIAEIYHDLTDKQQAGLLEALAGKRGGQVLAGILDDFSEVEKAMGEIEKSAGSADAEMGIVEESITYKLNALKQTWVGFVQDLIDRGTLGAFVDNLTIISEKLIQLMEAHPVATLTGIGTAFKTIATVLKGSLISKSVNSIVTTIEKLTNLRQGGLAAAGLFGGAGGVFAPIQEAIDGFRNAGAAIEAVSDSADDAGKAALEMANGVSVAGAEVKKTTTKVMGLSSAFSTLLPLLAVAAGVALFAVAWDHFTVTVKEAEEELDKTADKISDLKDQISDLESKDYRTSEQETRLQLLQQELEIQQKIYDVEEKRIRQEKYGQKISDIFDKDSLWSQYLNETSKTNNDSIDNLISKNVKALNNVESYKDAYKQVQQAYRDGLASLEDLDTAQEALNDATNEQEEIQSQIASKYLEYSDIVQSIENDIEDMKNNPLQYSREDIQDAEEMRDLYADIRDQAREAASEFIAGSESIYDFSNEIGSAFEHVEFRDLKESLVEAGKAGELTTEKVDEVLKKYPDFIKILSNAGIDAKNVASDVWAYIMNLVDPDKNERTQLANSIASQLITKKNSRGNSNLRSSELENQRKIQDYLDKLYRENPEGYQIIAGLDIDWTTFDADEAIARMEKALEEAGPAEVPIETSDIITSVQNVNDKLKPQFDELAQAYTSIFYGDNGFDLEVVDNALMQGIKSSFRDLDEKLGIDFEDGEKAVNKFLDAITSAETKSKSLAEQQEITQQAFNDLATAYFYAADGLGDLNDETRDALVQQFSKMGIVNADEIVDQIQYTQELKTALEGLSSTDIDFDERIQEATNNLEEEYRKIQDWGLGDYADQIKDKTIESKFGNVDMDKRTIIHWSDELKQTYKEELASWNYDPEIGGIDTVFGGSSPFELDGQEIEVAFTPIMVDENGQNPQFLSEGTVSNYIQKVLEQADKEVSETGNWSEEAVIKRAFEIDLEGINTDEIDSQGRKVGETYVHGIMAAIGDNAIDVGALMHFSGEEGAIQLAEESLDAYNSLKEKLESNTLSLSNVTAQEIALLEQEGLVAQGAGQQLAQLAIQEQLAAGIDMSSASSVQSLYALAKTADVATVYIEELNKVMSLFDQADAAEASKDFARAGLLRAEAIKRGNEVAKRIQEAAQEPLKINFEMPEIGGAKDAGSKAGKEAGEAAKDAFDEELSKLKDSYERGEITLAQYLAAYRALIDKYFDDTEANAEARAKALHDYLAEMKGYYDSAISGVTTLIDYRIKAIQKQKDAAIKALEEERDAALKVYDDQIKAIDKEIKAKQKQIKAIEKQKKEIEKLKKPLQDEIDKIQKANEERDRQLQLQKDLYELERLQNQRTQFIYKDGQMVYQADPDAIRDQREQVQKDEDDEKIAKLEKQIEAYDKQIEQLDLQVELINEEIDALEEQKELLEEQRAEVEEFYNKLIEDTTKYFDDLIAALEETKSKWERLAEIDKIASAWKDVGGVMEMLGFTVEDVLNDTPGAFEAFESAYIACLGNMNGQNDQYIQGLAEATGKSVDEIKALMGSMEEFGTATKQPLDEVGKAAEDLGTKSSGATSGVSNLSSATGELSTNSKEAADSLGDASVKVSELADKGTELSTIKSDLETIKKTLSDIGMIDLSNVTNNLSIIVNQITGVNNVLATLVPYLDRIDTVDISQLATDFQTLATNVQGVASALAGGETGHDVAGDMERIQNVHLSALAGELIIVSEQLIKCATALSGGENGLPIADSMERIGSAEVAANVGLLATNFMTLAQYLQQCFDVLIGGTEDATGGLVGALTSLSDGVTINLQPLIDQFTALYNAINLVTTALGGGTGGEAGAEGGASAGASGSETSGGESGEGGGTGLTGAIEAVKTAADTSIGISAEEEGENAIGDFVAMKTAVDNVSAAIGIGGEGEGTGEGGGEGEESGTLISAIETLSEVAQEQVEGEIIPRFEQFRDVLGEAYEHVNGIKTGIEELDGMEAEAKITIDVKVTGDGFPSFMMSYSGSIGVPDMNLEPGTYNAKYATGTAYPHYGGTAKVRGDWGVQQGGKSLVGELGQELVIRKSHFFTVGDHGPEFVNLEPGDIVLNHLQTREILDKKNLIKQPKQKPTDENPILDHFFGRSYAQGTLPSNFTPLSQANPEAFNTLVQNAELLRANTEDMKIDLADIGYATDDIRQAVQNITNNTNMGVTITFGDLQFTCNGITSAEVLDEVGNALQREFQGITLNAYQRAVNMA